MIDVAGVHYATAGVYAIATVVLSLLTLQIKDAGRRYLYPIIAIVALGGAMAVAWGAGLGTYSVGSGEIMVPQVITDYPTYAVLFGFTVYVANAGRRYIGLVVGLLLGVRFAYDLVAVLDGTLAIVANGAIIVGYGAAVALMYGPIAQEAAKEAPRRELLYKKTRNLIVFIFAMLVVWSQLQVSGILDEFTLIATLQYTNIIYRVGFAAFVVSNIDVLIGESRQSTEKESAVAHTVTSD
ncbi:bacteriorhodopsin [Halorubrum ezzemoulense]|uniref:bacteriorhodopsin n=1 Tax=Halorubrum ezzemoulense TaxID=337243 RepID=UPI00232A7FB7|nr:bacteriorhodopsin [Halorubrum ezzemoulense]MDB9302152.1 bacteriorhodopsin [Halorubrum ezzemoulense]